VFARTFAAAAAALSLSIGGAAAGEFEITGSAGVESRFFFSPPAFAIQQPAGRVQPSVFVQPELVYEWDDGDNRLTFEGFFRADADDGNRTHGDIREAHWLHQADDWDLLVGLGKVFWGVAESRHLVDIINQTDGVEDIDDEDKLGQPMVNLNLDREWGRLSFFAMSGFRLRSVPDIVAESTQVYESGLKRAAPDLAIRWAHTLGDWDIGVAHFWGTSREPVLVPTMGPGGPRLIQRYDRINQTSLDLQFTTGAWLFKLESLVRTGHGQAFAAVGEYHHDGRGGAGVPGTLFDDDWFAGMRLALNDENDTSLLVGGIVDVSNRSSLILIEAERRLFGNWKGEIEGRFLLNITDPLLVGVRQDDFVALRLTRFF
jgi:hypothetical protein